jgi:hypothetical protein
MGFLQLTHFNYRNSISINICVSIFGMSTDSVCRHLKHNIQIKDFVWITIKQYKLYNKCAKI